MAATMSFTGILALPGLTARIRHRQTIHVTANGDRGTRTHAVDHGNDRTFTQGRVNFFYAPFTKLFTDDAAGASGVMTFFRMLVKVTTDCCQLIGPRSDGLINRMRRNVCHDVVPHYLSLIRITIGFFFHLVVSKSDYYQGFTEGLKR
jgi:hypothetical protein